MQKKKTDLLRLLLETDVVENHIMENIIFNELKIRGFDVDVGVVEHNTKDKYDKEILYIGIEQFLLEEDWLR